MTKRQRPWGDSEEDQCRLRKSHQSQKDLDKRSESAMQVVHTKTLDMLFQGARKLNDKGQDPSRAKNRKNGWFVKNLFENNSSSKVSNS